jgi:hypothetical protein
MTPLAKKPSSLTSNVTQHPTDLDRLALSL